MTDWRKLGLLIEPDRALWWSRSHAMVPTPQDLGGGLFKIYYSGRDDDNRSHIGWALVDLSQSPKVIEQSAAPVLSPGELGCFDDNGVTPSCVIDRDDGLYLYYLGWNPGSTVRMNLFGGLAISTDEGRSFDRWSRAPILERCSSDPFLNTAPWVIRDGDRWRIYYVSGVGWIHRDLPRYLIKTGASDDGRRWQRDGAVCINFDNEDEVALARPYVVKENGRYRMWFSHKGPEYRMGYAESEDGVAWTRDDSQCRMEPSKDGFDSVMVEYAAVVRHGGRRFLFYNGDNYGMDGIGVAVQDD